jgi:hypothetical protein
MSESVQHDEQGSSLHAEGLKTVTQGVPGGEVKIVGGHSIGHSKEKCLYEHVSYSKRFPR